MDPEAARRVRAHAKRIVDLDRNASDSRALSPHRRVLARSCANLSDMRHRLRGIAIVALALSVLVAPGCRCSGGVSGSIDDAGFSLGTPPSSTSGTSRECGAEPCCGEPPEPCSQWLAKQREGGTPAR